MVKTIKIGDKSYDMKSSAFTIFAYKDKMGSDLLSDIKNIQKDCQRMEKLSNEESEESYIDALLPIIEKTLKLAYIMICEQDKNFKGYDDWLKELDNLMENQDWIMEVLELGTTPFKGRTINT